jgi:hypothetical protein
MTFKDRRNAGVADRRLRSRGGRRKTDRPAETIAEMRCGTCESGIARLCSVSTIPNGLILVYRCPSCDGEIQRPSAATPSPLLGAGSTSATRARVTRLDMNEGKEEDAQSTEEKGRREPPEM